MNRPAVLGVLFGAAIGTAYAASQWWEWRRREKAAPPRTVTALLPAAVARLVFLVLACALAIRFTEADKYWLTGSLAAAYSLLLIWQLKRMCTRRQRVPHEPRHHA